MEPKLQPVSSKAIQRIAFTGLLLSCIFIQSTWAQSSKTVKGKVSDQAGTPLGGVSVVVKSTAQGTSTGADGTYSVTVNENDELLFSMVGYTAVTRNVKGITSLNITLTNATATMEDVVVIGYGTTRKTDLTGAVGTVKAQQLQERPAPSLNQLIAGRIPGVQVNTNSGRPGGQTNVRIRGFSSINSTNNPLYVVDGVIIPVGSQTQMSNAIDFINPSDIASVEVLKDASATAIFGARGANGVILITTKKGSKSGGRITYDADVSVPELVRKADLLSTDEWLAVEQKIYDNAAKYDPVGWASGTKYKNPADLHKTLPKLFDAAGKPLYNTDWFKESTQSKLGSNHQLSFSNGNESGSYGVYAGYRNDNGLLLNSWLKRYSGRFVFDSKIKDWLRVDGSLSYNAQDENIVDQDVGGLNSVRQMVETLPLLPVKYPDGTWAGNKDYPGMDGGENPVNILLNRSFILHTQTILGNMGANISITKDLEFRSQFGVSVINRRTDQYSSRDLVRISADQRGIANVGYGRENYWSFENYVTYKKNFARKHDITALLGIAWNETNTNSFSAQSRNFIDDYYQYNNLGAGSQPQPPASGASRWSYNSYFTRLNYVLNNKYLATFTARADGASKFGESNKYAFFPSGALAWRVSEEDFLKNNAVISNLKLRTSYGATGNSELSPYSSLGNLGNGFAIFNSQRVTSTGTGSLANPELKWEKTHQFDAGVELGLFNNRIAVELDVYKRITKDMILGAPVPTSSGYGSINTNIGSMENQGVELSINTVNLETNDFTWITNFNISMNRNEVTKLATPADIYPGPGFLSNTQVIRVGEPVGSLFGYIRLGTWGSHEAAEAAKYSYNAGKPLVPGDVKLADLNNDGTINASDQTIIGNVMPKAYGSLINTFRYKNFDLTFDLQYNFGNDILNMTKHSAEDRLGLSNSYRSVLNAWTPDHQNTPIAEMRSYYSYAITNVDSRWVEDGSFIRGRNLLLGYNFSNDIIRKLHLSRLRVYASVQNLFVITDAMVNDPEVATYSNAFAQGQTFFDYPKPRLWTMGVNVSL